MRLTLEKALDVYFETGVDLYDTAALTAAKPQDIAAVCRVLRCSADRLPAIIQASVIGHEQYKKSGKARGVFNIIKMLELLGESGLSTYNVTPFELIAYIRGAYKRDWATTSAVLAVVYNSNCTKRSQAKKPADFNPMIEKPEPPARSLDDLFKGSNRE